MVIGAGALAGCPNPDGDYDKFLEETADIRNAGAQPVDGGGTQLEGGGGTEATTGTYLVACLASLSGKRADYALRFFGDTTFTPSENGEGTLHLVLSPLAVTATVLDKANTVGDPIDLGTLPVSAQGAFSGSVAKSNIAKDANTISPRDIVIENTQLEGIYAASGNFCSSFETQVTAPIQQPIVAKCTYVAAEPGTTYSAKAPTKDDPTSAIVVGDLKLTADMFGCAQ